MTERIREFLRAAAKVVSDEGPVLVVDLDVVGETNIAFAKALPTRAVDAVKANPAPEVLSLLAKLGSCFDTRFGRRDRNGVGGGHG